MGLHDDLFRRTFVKPVPGRALIVGSKVYKSRDDARQRFENVIGIDLETGEGVDHVWDMERAPFSYLDVFGFFHVECCSVLEHSKAPWRMAENIEANLVQGGSLYVCCPTVWRYHPYPDDYWRFTHAGIALLFSNVEWKVMRYSDYTGGLFEPPRIPVKKNVYGGEYSKIEIHAFGHRK